MPAVCLDVLCKKCSQVELAERNKIMQRNDEQAIIESPLRETRRAVPGHPPDRRRRCLKAALRVSDSPDDHKAPRPLVTRPDGAPVGRVGPLEASVAALVANPTRASEVPVHQIPALVAELASEQATLCAIQGVLTTRLLTSPPPKLLRTSQGIDS